MKPKNQASSFANPILSPLGITRSASQGACQGTAFCFRPRGDFSIETKSQNNLREDPTKPGPPHPQARPIKQPRAPRSQDKGYLPLSSKGGGGAANCIPGSYQVLSFEAKIPSVLGNGPRQAPTLAQILLSRPSPSLPPSTLTKAALLPPAPVPLPHSLTCPLPEPRQGERGRTKLAGPNLPAGFPA